MQYMSHELSERLVYVAAMEQQALGRVNTIRSSTEVAHRIYHESFELLDAVGLIAVRGLNRLRELSSQSIKPPRFLPLTIASTMNRLSAEQSDRRWLSVVPYDQRRGFNPIEWEFELEREIPDWNYLIQAA